MPAAIHRTGKNGPEFPVNEFDPSAVVPAAGEGKSGKSTVIVSGRATTNANGKQAWEKLACAQVPEAPHAELR
jgi:hypothetical protein